MSNDVKQLIRQLERHGCEIRRTRRGHFLVSFDGRVVGGLPGTPSDHRSLPNSRAQLRRNGVRFALTLPGGLDDRPAPF